MTSPGQNPSFDFDNPANFVRNRPPAPRRPPSPAKRFVLKAAGAVLLLAVCSGLNMYFDKDDKPKNTARNATPAPAYTPATPTYTYSAPPTYSAPAATPTPTANALDAVDKGDCLKNTGTDYDPEMVPIACGPGTYQVLKRIYGTIDGNQCQSVSGATTTYTVTYYVNNIPQISRSYVFCLKRR
ncbi:LppU/SCO3897 family protein [Virgisporangium aurantiacum]|uniref:Uncharacterized protein n=1 Tax=Virgisporangium aurantiacum TaxID=175570 RepID=A0A8J4E319_9ACTN|nr:hypothetical protein [Virgisporangium aurantiacum]GIJ59606.1 hypothetical protein Vau01_071220 [Virgisporangium aurantiacum]